MADEESPCYSRSLQMEKRYLSEICIPDSGTKTGVRNGCVRLLSMTLPPLMMREVERVWDEVLRPVWVFRTDTEFEPPPPEKVRPWVAVMQKSRYREASVSVSGEEASAKQQDVPSSVETTATALCLTPEKSDNKSDNMSSSVFTEPGYK